MNKKTLALDVKQVDSSGEKYFTFEGLLAAYGNVDHDNDMIEKGAFADWLTESKAAGQISVPVFWSHSSAEPIGVFPTKEIKETDEGLWVKGILPKADSFVSGRVIPQMEVGSVRKMSIGYKVRDFEYKGSVRHLKNIALWEGSLVALPANDNAKVTGFKSVTPFSNLPMADRQRPWDSEAAIGRVRQWAGVTGAGDLEDPDVQKRYRQAFLWYDGRNADLMGAYKLPFADIIDGQLTAVPRAIFAAAGAMRGARGGVDLAYEERPAVIYNIEQYYEKLGLESPFGEKNFRLDDLAAVDERNLEKILKTGARFTGKLALTVISAIKSAGLRDAEQGGRRDAAAENSELIETIDTILNQIRKG